MRLTRSARRTLAAALLVGMLGACAPDPGPAGTGTSIAPETATPAATAAATPAAPATATPTPMPSPPPTPGRTDAAGGVYLALGDSVTFGVGVPEPQRDAFPALVAERAGDLEARVLAVPGETATGFLDRRIDDVEGAVGELGDRVELVTIGLGANEILRIRRAPACLEDRASPECQRIATDAAQDAASALDAVVERVADALEAAGSDAPILLLAYYNPDVEPIAAATIVGADGVVDCDPDDPGPGLNDRIACIAERRGTELVDLYAAFLGREEELTGMGRGDVHPTVEGHRVIADAMVEALGDAGE